MYPASTRKSSDIELTIYWLMGPYWLIWAWFRWIGLLQCTNWKWRGGVLGGKNYGLTVTISSKPWCHVNPVASQ
jgi:hypothetical protein